MSRSSPMLLQNASVFSRALYCRTLRPTLNPSRPGICASTAVVLPTQACARASAAAPAAAAEWWKKTTGVPGSFSQRFAATACNLEAWRSSTSGRTSMRTTRASPPAATRANLAKQRLQRELLETRDI